MMHLECIKGHSLLLASLSSNGKPISNFVMPGLEPGIHVLTAATNSKDVEGRDEPGHDDG
jgi:hypothetical protein